ncbi:MAG: hypothetical protein OXD45_15960 [Rhodobacteraceae bacterium]|nr:hypothetical protein [Paracoccaceae bacterium]
MRWTSPSRRRDRTFLDCRGITDLPQAAITICTIGMNSAIALAGIPA